MLGRFFSDSVTYGVGAIAARGVSFLLVPIFTRLLAPDQYGTLDILTVFGTLVSLTVALEINQALIRFFPEAADDADRGRIASTALVFGSAAYAVFLLVGLVLAEPIGSVLLGSSEMGDVVRIAVVAISASGLFLLVQTQMRAQFAARIYALAGFTYAVGAAVVSIVLVAGIDAGVRGVFVGQFVGAVLGIATVFISARTFYRPHLDAGTLQDLLRFSAPLVISSVAVFAGTYLDRFAIRLSLGLTEVGLFGLGFRIASIATLLTIAIQTALVPLIYERRADPALGTDLARLFRLYVGGCLVFVVAITSLSPLLVAVLAPPAYSRAGDVVPLLAAAGLASTASAFFPGLAIVRRSGWIALVSIAGAAMNVALLLVLVPAWGIVGAGLATLLVALGVLATSASLSARFLPVPHRWLAICSAVVVCAVGVVTIGLFGVDSLARTAVGAVTVVVMIAALIVLGIITKADWNDARASFGQLRHRMARQSRTNS
jgi:O-antigen/teichoic acid export membrane protein